MPIEENGNGPYALGQSILFPIDPIIGRDDIEKFILEIDLDLSRISPERLFRGIPFPAERQRFGNDPHFYQTTYLAIVFVKFIRRLDGFQDFLVFLDIGAEFHILENMFSRRRGHILEGNA
jgi:hypothetical protein